MPQLITCTSCDNTMTFGHFADSARSDVLCRNCLARFALPTANRYGAAVGDVLRLHRIAPAKRRRPEALIPTDVTITVIQSDHDGFVHYQMETAVCPDCASLSLVDHLNDGDPCPYCSTGLVESSFLEP